jgi:hypothetical protein
VRTAPSRLLCPRVAVISYRRFEKTYRSNFQRSRIQKMKMELIGCLTTSVRNYHYVLRSNLEERSSLLIRGGSPKSRNVLYGSNILIFFNGKTRCFLTPAVPRINTILGRWSAKLERLRKELVARGRPTASDLEAGIC